MPPSGGFLLGEIWKSVNIPASPKRNPVKPNQE